jgi:DNA mismatch endonuclease (patch repair protein)
MSRIRSTGSEPELKVRHVLSEAGFRYRLHAKDLPGKPDIVFRRLRLAVFVHGCFWHGHICREAKRPRSNLKYWSPKILGNMARDLRTSHRLRAAGWSCFVIRECSIETGLSRLLRKLASLR